MQLLQVQMQVMAQIQQQQMQMQGWGASSSTQPPPGFVPPTAAPPTDEVEVDVPAEVSIATWALNWKHPPGQKAERTNCPMPLFKKKDWTYDLTAFSDWLPVHSQVKKDCSLDATAGNLERFFQLLEIPAGAHCPDPEMGRGAGNPASVFDIGVQPHISSLYQLP